MNDKLGIARICSIRKSVGMNANVIGLRIRCEAHHVEVGVTLKQRLCDAMHSIHDPSIVRDMILLAHARYKVPRPEGRS